LRQLVLEIITPVNEIFTMAEIPSIPTDIYLRLIRIDITGDPEVSNRSPIVFTYEDPAAPDTSNVILTTTGGWWNGEPSTLNNEEEQSFVITEAGSTGDETGASSRGTLALCG